MFLALERATFAFVLNYSSILESVNLNWNKSFLIKNDKSGRE